MKINGVVASAVLLVVLAVAMLSTCGPTDPNGTRAWEYGPGEEIQLGDDRSIVLQPQFAGRIDVPMTHSPGDPDPASLQVRVYGPADERYIVGVYPQAYARREAQSTRRLIERGEYPNTKMESLTIDGVRIDLSVTDDSEDVSIDMNIWSGDCDPLWVQATDNPALTKMVRQGGSSEEISRLILDGVGLKLNGVH